jgi:predicted permease
VDRRVALATATIALVTGILTGLVPALQGSNSSVTAGLKLGGAGDGPRRSRLRSGLLISQAALSLVLLVGAGLFVRSLDRLVHLDTGYDPEPVAVAQVDLAIAGYPREAYAAFYERLEERVQALPEAERTAIAFTIPLRNRNSMSIRLTDRDTTPVPPTGSPSFNGVTPSFFETAGMRLLRGRLFAKEDRPGTEPVMVINQAMAEFYWPRRDPLGQCVGVGADSLPCRRVVGVVATARIEELQEPAVPLYYMPLAQVGAMSTNRALFVRARSGNGADLVAPLRKIILEMAPNLPYPDVRAFQSLIDPHVQPWRLGATMFGIFGGLALLVACAGLYSVLSYTVARRRRELGVRSALGASPGRLVAGVVRDGARSVLIGLGVGAGTALLLGRFMAPLLVDVSPRDPLVFAVVSLTLLTAGVLAALAPARRAMQADPIEALRSD